MRHTEPRVAPAAHLLTCCDWELLFYLRSDSLHLTEAVLAHKTRTEYETHPFVVDNDSFLTGCFVGTEVLLDAPVTSPETAHTLLAPGIMMEKQLLRWLRQGEPPSLELQRRKSMCSRCRLPQQGHCSTVIEREVHRSNEDVMETHYELYGDMIWKWKQKFLRNGATLSLPYC